MGPRRLFIVLSIAMDMSESVNAPPLESEPDVAELRPLVLPGLEVECLSLAEPGKEELLTLLVSSSSPE